MVRRVFIATICGVMFCGLSTFADDDPIKNKLDTAKEEYDKEVDKVFEELLALLKQKQAAAKKAGNLQNLEQVEAEIDAFEKDEVLPRSVSTRAYEKAMGRVCKKMEDAYIIARKEYTQADKIDEAKALDRELEQFKASSTAVTASASTEVNKMLLDASRVSMKANPNLYFYVCTSTLGERVLRATRRRYANTPNGNHPDGSANPLRDVRLGSFGGEPSAAVVRHLGKMCFDHNARVNNK